MMQPISFTDGAWLHQPAKAAVAADRLTLETEAETDFWCRTHYGFTHTNGHALLFDMPDRFVSQVRFSGRFQSKYEQAGLLLWESENRWIKAGIEYADGRPNLAVVVTDGRSDWSMAPADEQATDCTIRMTVTESAVIVHARQRQKWQILRVANFVSRGARIGPMACSPLSDQLEVTFSDFCVGPAPDDPLYLTD